MEIASKFNGTLMVKSQLFELAKGMLSVTGPNNTQKDGTLRDSFSTYILAKICMLPQCPLQLLPRPSIFTIFNLYQVYVLLVQTQLMGLSNAGSHVGLVWGAVPAA
eukprot:1160604-Pelagomonas_calceolata.AAC.10